MPIQIHAAQDGIFSFSLKRADRIDGMSDLCYALGNGVWSILYWMIDRTIGSNRLVFCACVMRIRMDGFHAPDFIFLFWPWTASRKLPLSPDSTRAHTCAGYSSRPARSFQLSTIMLTS